MSSAGAASKTCLPHLPLLNLFFSASTSQTWNVNSRLHALGRRKEIKESPNEELDDGEEKVVPTREAIKAAIESRPPVFLNAQKKVLSRTHCPLPPSHSGRTTT